MYKKFVSITLSILLLACGVASPRIIESFDNLLEKFNYIVSANAPLTSVDSVTHTYKSGTFQKDLDFKTVSLTEKQAKNLEKGVTVEKDFLVKAQTVDGEEFIEDLLGNENTDSVTAEGYPWNGYTLKLNGLVDYIKRTKTGWDDLKQTTRDLAEKYSTNSII